MICKKCEKEMIGGMRENPRVCSKYEGTAVENGDDVVFCEPINFEFFAELVETLNQWKSGEGLDAAFIHKLNRLTDEANKYL